MLQLSRMSRSGAFVAALATVSASAWTLQSKFVGRPVASSVAKRSVAALHRPSSSQLNMFFGSFFSNGNPLDAITKKKTIDYKTLDHPGPELAAFAEQGLAPAESLRDPNLKLATFAGGCFWGLELAYQRVPGVAYTAVGYTHGDVEAPTYDYVCSGGSGHTEAVIVYYDPKLCSYNQLLDVLFGRIDPTQVNGQGNDRGTQYRTGVYFHTPEQEQAAKAKIEQISSKYRRPIATELKPAQPFWPAERYHQQYLEKGGQNAEKGATDQIRCYG
ncbi:hypothetical protein MPSEU_001011800 [Mayamaea pseudoterrestris]|nr:hypothetical protein MPSEU_001011800 [Mayamaea pseudoterrestris]